MNFKTENIYVGVRYDYKKTFFSKGEHIRGYDAFFKTDLGYKSITNSKIYPNYEEYCPISKNLVAYLEPISYYLDSKTWLTTINPIFKSITSITMALA